MTTLRTRHILFMVNMAVAMLLFVVGNSFMRAMTQSITLGIEALGTDTIVVGDPENGFVNSPQGTGLDAETVAGLRAGLADRFLIAAAARSYSSLEAGGRTEQGSVYYVDPVFFGVTRVRLLHGRTITPYEAEAREDVCLISEELARRFDDPAQVTIGGAGCRVIGTVASEEVIPNQSIALAVYRPLATLHEAAGSGVQSISSVFLRYRFGEPPAAAIAAVAELLPPDARQADMIWVGRAYWKTRRQVTDGLWLLVSGLSLVLIMMAAAGLANSLSLEIMSRRAEIGLRLAIGATRADIFRMVMGDGLAVAMLGGAIGVGGGTLVTHFLLAPLLDQSTLLPGARVSIDLWSVAAATLVLSAAAIAATIFPSRRAMRVDPSLVLRNL